MSQFIVVYVTAKNKTQARRIARALLEARLIACANIIPSVESHYTWRNKRCVGQEVMLILKTTQKCFQKLAQTVKSVHDYQTPEIIAMPLVAGDQAYLNWITESVCL